MAALIEAPNVAMHKEAISRKRLMALATANRGNAGIAVVPREFL
jgi:hypothetical protein